MKQRFFKNTAFVSMTIALLNGGISTEVKGSTRPNIIVILSDDMGYSDIGCYGGEINTPNLDKLAANGLRYSQFYNTARCCPTRASLLTALYPHQTGIGHMIQDKKLPGYQGNGMSRSTSSRRRKLINSTGRVSVDSIAFTVPFWVLVVYGTPQRWYAVTNTSLRSTTRSINPKKSGTIPMPSLTMPFGIFANTIQTSHSLCMWLIPRHIGRCMLVKET
jgi:hypothetical protein